MSDIAIETIDRTCVAPESCVAVPEGYIHYPISDEDMDELYLDLMDFGELSDTEAAEALGFTAVAALANCPQKGSIMGMVHRGITEHWGDENLVMSSVKEAYLSGIAIADKEWRDE